MAHGYALYVMGQFQAFVRDLHDTGIDAFVLAMNPPTGQEALLRTAVAAGRAMDSGNPTVTTLNKDFARIGLTNFNDELGKHDPRWNARGTPTDKKVFETLLDLRNALAHGNGQQIVGLRQRGVADTVTFVRSRLPVLNRVARTMDHVVWIHVTSTLGANSWP